MTTVTEAREDKKRGPAGLLRRLFYCLAALLIAFLVCFFFAADIFRFLSRPVADAMIANGVAEQSQQRIFTALTEVFFTYVKVAFFAAAFVCFPWFVAQALRAWNIGRGRIERFGAPATLVMLAIPFVLGGAVAYYLVFPRELGFWMAFQVPPAEGALAIELEPKINEYLSILMKRIFTFAVVFQLPVVLFLFLRAGRVEENFDGRA